MCGDRLCRRERRQSVSTRRLRLTNAQFVARRAAPLVRCDRARRHGQPRRRQVLSRAFRTSRCPATSRRGPAFSSAWRTTPDTGSCRRPCGTWLSSRLSSIGSRRGCRCHPTRRTGWRSLIVRGVDADGNIGSLADVHTITVAAPMPSGAMVITLEWDTNADLDLHAVVPVDPSVTLPARRRRGSIGRGLGEGPPRPAAELARLRRERIRPWRARAGSTSTPTRTASSTAAARRTSSSPARRPRASTSCASTRSRCAARPRRSGQLTVTTPDGDVVNPATWQATDADTRGNHGIGAGRLAVDFTL